MEIKAVKFRKEGFYTQPFVMGGKRNYIPWDTLAEFFGKNM